MHVCWFAPRDSNPDKQIQNLLSLKKTVEALHNPKIGDDAEAMEARFVLTHNRTGTGVKVVKTANDTPKVSG